MFPVMLQNGGGFSPKTIAGLQLWFDASNAGSITISSGSSISQWNDLSGNGNNATQSTAANQPTLQTSAQNGKNTVRFDNSNSQTMVLTNSLTYPATYSEFCVAKCGQTGGIIELFGTPTHTLTATLEWASNKLQLYDVNNNNLISSASFTDTTGYHLLEAMVGGSSGTDFFYYDVSSVAGSVSAQAQTGPLTNLGYGDGTYSNGYFAEVLFYNTVIASADRLTVEAYLRNKWATP